MNYYVEPNILLTDEESGDNVISLEKIKNESGFSSQHGFKAYNNDNAIDIDDDNNSNLSSKFIPQTLTPTVNLQNSFQPCSTPVHLQRRFMVIYLISKSYLYNLSFYIFINYF